MVRKSDATFDRCFVMRRHVITSSTYENNRLCEYQEWRKSVRYSQHGAGCILSDNGNCQEWLDFEDDDQVFHRHYVVLDIAKFQVEIYKEQPSNRVGRKFFYSAFIVFTYISEHWFR